MCRISILMRTHKRSLSSEPLGKKGAEHQRLKAREGSQLVGGEERFRLVAASASGRVLGSGPSRQPPRPPGPTKGGHPDHSSQRRWRWGWVALN